MKKKIGYTFLVILSILIIVGYIGVRKFNNALFKEKPNHFVYTSESKPIHFDWANDSIGDYYETQAAMTIPLKIEGLAHHFYMQFDTGSPYTFIYEHDLKSLRSLGLDIKEVVKDEVSYIESLNFILDDNHLKASMIKILAKYGNSFDKNDTIPNIGIGTIGSDFITNRITAIDFKNQNIKLYNERPPWMLSLPDFKPFDFTGRRLMLPATIDGKDYELFYDSGCSAFGLITTKNRFDDYTDENTEEINYDANSWGSGIPMRNKITNKTFTIGNTNLNLKRVTYVNMYTKLQPLITPFTPIGGWLGNQPFNESTLIIDTKTEEFLISESSID